MASVVPLNQRPTSLLHVAGIEVAFKLALNAHVNRTGSKNLSIFFIISVIEY
jgi:hypothetical protein